MSSNPTFTDVQRREIFTEIVSKDGVPALAVEKALPGGSSKRIMLLNKVDAQQMIKELDRFLNEVYSRELAGVNASLSPADMVVLFGEDPDDY